MLRNEKAFTLIEMLIVLLIISVLIILIVPNLSNSSKEVNDKGCDALVAVVQTQVHLFYLEKHRYPTDIEEMIEENYLTEQQKKCSNGKTLVISGEGNVQKQ